VFLAFFAIIVFPIVVADFPNHTGNQQGVMELYSCLLNCGPCYRYPPRDAKENTEIIVLFQPRLGASSAWRSAALRQRG
jgi:hypothetical protein